MQICELQATLSEYRSHEENLLKYIREIEQKNDDLERSHRYDVSTYTRIHVLIFLRSVACIRDSIRMMLEKDHTGMAFLYVLEYIIFLFV